MSDINTARSSFDHAGFEKFMNASSDSLSDQSSPRKKPGRGSRATGGSKKRASGARQAKIDEAPWWEQGVGGAGSFDVNSSGGSSEVAQLGTGKNFLRRTREPPQSRGAAGNLDDTLQQSGVASIGQPDDAIHDIEDKRDARAGSAPVADDSELRLQLTRSSLGDSEAPPLRGGFLGDSRDAEDLTTLDTESAAVTRGAAADELDDPSAVGGLAGVRGKPSMLSKVSLLESLDSSSQQLQQPSSMQQQQQQHNGDTLHSQTDLSAVRDAYKRKLDTLEESTDQRHSRATTGFFASGLNSLPSDQLQPQQQQQQQSAGAMTVTAPSATQSFGLQIIRPANTTEQNEMSIDDLLAEHNEIMTARPEQPEQPRLLTPSPPPPPPPVQQQPQPAQRRQRPVAFDETKIVANPKVARPPSDATRDSHQPRQQPARPSKKQQQQQQQQQQPQAKFGHVKSSGYGKGRGGGPGQRPQSLPPQQPPHQPHHQPQKQRQSQQVNQQQQQQQYHLREELDEWRDLLRAEKAHRVKLESDLRLMELERAKETESERRKHEQEVQQLRQEICTLEARLEVEPQQQQQQQQASVWRFMKQRPLGPDVTRDEVDKLADQLREQEELMAGYQRENERLYAELKSTRASGKGLADALSGQKLQLEQELREAREQLERQEVQLRSRLPHQSPSSAASAGPVSNAAPLLLQQERCAKLEAELRACRRRLDEAETESASCQRDRLELQQQLDRLTRERSAAADQLTAARSVRGVELDKMREQYEAEIDRLQRKVKWFVENQRLVDKDQAKLREQEAAITELRGRLESAEKQRQQLLSRRRGRQGGKAVDGDDPYEDTASAARVRDLERQVRELESILAATRRRGDAVADSLVGGGGSGYPDATREHLERRCRELEARLAERESAEARSLRALRQRYEAAKEDYESRIQVLEADLKRFKEAQGRPHGSLTSLQRELEALRVRHREKMLEKDREIERIRTEAASEAAQTQNERRALARAEALQRELREKQAELDRAKRERDADRDRERQAYSSKLQSAVEKHQRQVDGLRQQLVAMETSLASARAELATERNLLVESRRRSDAKLAEMTAAHKRELDRLVAEHAKTFAESRVAELQARLDSQEAVIEHLKAHTAATSSTHASETSEQLRRRERELSAEVAELRAALADERAAHTPQMRQFVTLRDRIKQLEARHAERERGVEQLVRETRAAARSDAQAEVTRWRQTAETRARQIDQFRAELDLILEVLRELQRRGVSFPVPPALKDTLSKLSS